MRFRTDVSIVSNTERAVLQQKPAPMAGESVHHTMWTENDDFELGHEMVATGERPDESDVLPIEVFIRF